MTEIILQATENGDNHGEKSLEQLAKGNNKVQNLTIKAELSVN